MLRPVDFTLAYDPYPANRYPVTFSTYSSRSPFDPYLATEMDFSVFYSKFKDAQNFSEGALDQTTTGSFSAINITDTIAVFALEKTGEKITKLICWHFGTDHTIEEIKNDFEMLTSKNKSYEIYLVGGWKSSTEGWGSLLHRIQLTLKTHFDTPPAIRKIFTNIGGPNLAYHANVDMHGTLSLSLSRY